MTSTQRNHGRIVVGVDGSPSSLAALDWAARQGELMGSSLELVMAWEWPTVYGVPFAFPTDWDPAADAARVLDEAVATIRGNHADVDIQQTVVEGHPAPALVGASRGAQLLVVGCRGHGEFAGMLLGSVSAFLATHAHCPVVIVRGDEKKTD